MVYILSLTVGYAYSFGWNETLIVTLSLVTLHICSFGKSGAVPV